MPHYIEPRDSNGEPIDNTKVKIWYVMKLGAVIASSESLDIAKRMTAYLDQHEIDFDNMNISISNENINEMIFYKAQERVFVYSQLSEAFMMREKWTTDKTKKDLLNQKISNNPAHPPIKPT